MKSGFVVIQKDSTAWDARPRVFLDRWAAIEWAWDNALKYFETLSEYLPHNKFDMEYNFDTDMSAIFQVWYRNDDSFVVYHTEINGE